MKALGEIFSVASWLQFSIYLAFFCLSDIYPILRCIATKSFTRKHKRLQT